MSAGELRALTRQRRQVTAAVTTQARHLAGAEGLRVTEAVAEQVEATLTAAMIDAQAGEALRSGLLVAPLTTTGLEPLPEDQIAAALACPAALGFSASPREKPAPPAPTGLHVVPDPDADAKALATATERLEAAVADQDEAQEALDEATGEVERLTARSLQLEAELDELRRKVSSLEDEADALDEEIAEAEEVRDGAAADLRTATGARDTAQRAHDRLSDRLANR